MICNEVGLLYSQARISYRVIDDDDDEQRWCVLILFWTNEENTVRVTLYS